MNNAPPKKKETERQEVLEESEKDIKIYNSRKKPVESKQTKSNEEKKENSKKFKAEKYDEKYDDTYKGDYDENYPRYKANKMKRYQNSGAMLNFKYNDKNDYDMEESIGTDMGEYSSVSDRKRKKRSAKVENDFNIFEIIITQFFKCCMCENMKLKMMLMKKLMKYYSKKWISVTM